VVHERREGQLDGVVAGEAGRCAGLQPLQGGAAVERGQERLVGSHGGALDAERADACRAAGPHAEEGQLEAAAGVALARGGVVAEEAGGVAPAGLELDHPDCAGLVLEHEVGLFHGRLDKFDVCGEFAGHGWGADAQAGEGDAGDGAEQLAQGMVAVLAVEARTVQRHTSRRRAALQPS
jgi:hypothetical protein